METWKRHRPLLSGLKIDALSKNDDGTYTRVNRGTLTGLATRKSDGKKVLVTCPHKRLGMTSGG